MSTPDAISRICGSITAIITPFSGDQIDFAAFEGLLERQIDAGTQAIVVAGSTGEAAALTREEYRQLLLCAVAKVAGRIPLLAGTGQSSTRATLEFAAIAKTSGVDAQLVVAPPYVRPTQAGMEQHYRQIADQSELPVMLYNVPGRTGCDLLPETVAHLAQHQRIFAIKEAVADRARIQALVNLQTPTFSVLSGDDPSALDALQMGAKGLISVANNYVPAQMRAMVESGLQQNFTQARAIREKLRPLFDALNEQPNPIVIKWFCTQRGWCQNQLRLPLLPLEAEFEAKFQPIAHHHTIDITIDQS